MKLEFSWNFDKAEYYRSIAMTVYTKNAGMLSVGALTIPFVIHDWQMVIHVIMPVSRNYNRIAHHTTHHPSAWQALYAGRLEAEGIIWRNKANPDLSPTHSVTSRSWWRPIQDLHARQWHKISTAINHRRGTRAKNERLVVTHDVLLKIETRAQQ